MRMQLWYYGANRIASVKAVELRQKNQDDLLSAIESYKKELATVVCFFAPLSA